MKYMLGLFLLLVSSSPIFAACVVYADNEIIEQFLMKNGYLPTSHAEQAFVSLGFRLQVDGEFKEEIPLLAPSTEKKVWNVTTALKVKIENEWKLLDSSEVKKKKMSIGIFNNADVKDLTDKQMYALVESSAKKILKSLKKACQMKIGSPSINDKNRDSGKEVIEQNKNNKKVHSSNQ